VLVIVPAFLMVVGCVWVWIGMRTRGHDESSISPGTRSEPPVPPDVMAGLLARGARSTCGRGAAVLGAVVVMGLAAGPAAAAPLTSDPSIVTVTTGVHPGYDRLVITSTGPWSSYTIGYTSVVINSPKGDRADVPGNAFLVITLRGVDNWGALPFPARITVGGPELIAVVRTQDFEGYVTLALGLLDKTTFHVYTLTNPNRLVIDVTHPASGVALPATGSGQVIPIVVLGLALLTAGATLRRLGRPTSA